MEANPNIPQAAVALSPSTMNVIFKSDEEMKEFYLKMALFLDPTICMLQRTETQLLKDLLRKLEKSLAIIQQIGNHPWEEGVAEIQNAAATYLLQPGMDRKQQLRTNTTIGQHLQFLTRVAGKSNIIKPLENTYHRHCEYVRHLLEKV